MNDELIAFVALVIFALVLAGGAIAFSVLSCKYRWAESGMASSWSLFQGCLVQTKDGRWIPDDRYRELP